MEDPEADTTPEAEYNAVQWFIIIYKVTGSWMARQAMGQNQKNSPTRQTNPEKKMRCPKSKKAQNVHERKY